MVSVTTGAVVAMEIGMVVTEMTGLVIGIGMTGMCLHGHLCDLTPAQMQRKSLPHIYVESCFANVC